MTALYVHGIVIDHDTIKELCKEHNITENHDINQVCFVLMDDSSKYIEQAIEKYQDKKAQEKDI